MALNWESEPEEEKEVKPYLQVPEIEIAGLSRTVPREEKKEEVPGKVIEIEEDKEDEDRGRTIDLY